MATLEEAGPDQLAFLTHLRYRAAAEATRAGAILVPRGTELPGRDVVEVEHPYLALAKAIGWLHPESRPPAGVSPDARLGPGVEIGVGATVGPFAVIEEGVRVGACAIVGAGSFIGANSVVGEDTLLHPRVVVYRGTRIGRRCIVHAGAVLGADGYGFATVEGRHLKIPQVGTVSVEDDVEIGANTTVDRGALSATVIGEGSKLDDLVMIAHGVRVGPHALLAAQSGIAGSTRTGAGVTFAGQSGAAGHLKIGNGCVIAAKTAVFSDLPDGAFVAGVPARDHREWKRAVAAEKRLPELRAQLRRLERRVRELEGSRGED